MLLRVTLLLCIQATIFQGTNAQCIPQAQTIEPLLFDPFVPAIPIVGRIVGGNLVLDTKNPNSASGVSISSEQLLIDGNVIVTGKLPFLGTVALDGIVPAAGKSAVSYECGANLPGESFVGIYSGMQNGVSGVEVIGPGLGPVGPIMPLVAPEIPNGLIGAEFLAPNCFKPGLVPNGMILGGPEFIQNGFIGAGILPPNGIIPNGLVQI